MRSGNKNNESQEFPVYLNRGNQQQQWQPRQEYSQFQQSFSSLSRLKTESQILNRSPLLQKHQQSQLKRNEHAHIFSAKYHMLPYVQHNSPMYSYSEITPIIPRRSNDSPTAMLSQSKSMKIYDCILDKSRLIIKKQEDQDNEGNYYKLNFDQMFKEDNFKKKDLILQKQQELIEQAVQIRDRKKKDINNRDVEVVEGKKEYYNYIKDYSLRLSQGRQRTSQEQQKGQESSFGIIKQQENQDFKGGEQQEQQLQEKIKEKQLEQFLQGDIIGYRNSLEKQLSQEAIVDSLKRQKAKRNNRNQSPDYPVLAIGNNHAQAENFDNSQNSISIMESSEVLLPQISKKEKRTEYRPNRGSCGRERSGNSRGIHTASMKELDGQLGQFQKKVESQRQIRPWMNNNKNALTRSRSERKYELNQRHGEGAYEQNRFQESAQYYEYGDSHQKTLPKKMNYQNSQSEGKKKDTEEQEQCQEQLLHNEDNQKADYSPDKSVLKSGLGDGCSRLIESSNIPAQYAKLCVLKEKQCYDFKFQPSYQFVISQQ